MTKIFFREDDFVKEETQEFKDFWKFLLKFQALEKRKAEKEGRDRKRKRTDEVSEILGVPLEANLGHGLNFQLKPPGLSCKPESWRGQLCSLRSQRWLP